PGFMWRFSLVPCSGGWSWKPDSLGFHWRTAAFNLQLRLGHCRLRERLSQLGYVNDDTFDSVQAKFEMQFPAWIETDTAAAERMAAVIGFDPSNLEAAVDAVMKSASEKGQDLTFTGPAVRPVNLRDRRQVRDYIVEKVRQRYEDAKKHAGGVRIAQIEDVVYTPVGFVFERAVGEMHPPPFGVRDGEKVGHLAYFWSVL
ncbi:hypothetical protein QZM64_41210, partial [Burkholderia cepacia]|uniref:hypothetical protein n=1 Tax=Burkholderia cepacia TaxID=292 RepID=UPI0026547830